MDENGNIVDSCFKTFGCGSAIASSSVATEWVKGKTVNEVRVPLPGQRVPLQGVALGRMGHKGVGLGVIDWGPWGHGWVTQPGGWTWGGAGSGLNSGLARWAWGPGCGAGFLLRRWHLPPPL